MALKRSALTACRSVLIQGLMRSMPGVALDEKGYVDSPERNLIDGVYLDNFKDDLDDGDGNELASKFKAAHSSSALAVNAFAPFKNHYGVLRLAGESGFTGLKFERKCPHGIPNRRSPNLDVVAEGPTGVVAIESKCLETLSSHRAKFSPVYDSGIRDARRQTAWFEEMGRLIGEPRAYRRLDAAQLIKHAFGILHTFEAKPTKLLYLFWEPANSHDFPVFAEHRAEIARFAAAIGGESPTFSAMSYPELWQSWATAGQPAWLKTHAQRLRARYEVVAD